jgi:hypothetical protein
MSFKFWCARCGQSYTTSRESPGKKIRCRVCGYIQQIPDHLLDSTTAAADSVLDATPAPRVDDSPRASRRPARCRRTDFLQGLLRATAAEPGRLQGWSLCLVALSAADIFMTFTLLKTSHTFYESNPVAQWFFNRWNMAGMVGFKFGVIGGVIALGEFIERRQPGRGRFVLMVGCAAAVLVIWHGLRLYLNHGL